VIVVDALPWGEEEGEGGSLSARFETVVLAEEVLGRSGRRVVEVEGARVKVGEEEEEVVVVEDGDGTVRD
jgi:hypothetical protein